MKDVIQKHYNLIHKIIDKYRTPLYICFEEVLKLNINTLRKMSSVYPDVRIYYSFKTNWLPAICRAILQQNVGAEVVSGFELWLARALGAENDRIIFNGPCKEDHELEAAFNPPVKSVHIDSISELIRIIDNRDRYEQVNIGIRISPASIPDTLSFGIPADDYKSIDMIIELCKKNGFTINILHTHIGPYINYKKRFIETCEALLNILRYIYKKFGFFISILDIGGGITTDIMGKENEVLDNTGEYFSIIAEIVQKHVDNGDIPAFPVLLLEPGRFIVNNAVMIISTVYALKTVSGKNIAVIDAGINVTGGIRNKIYPLFMRKDSLKYTLVGPLCYPGDLIAPGIMLPSLRVYDKLAITNCGAYSFSNSQQFIKTRPGHIMIKSDGSYFMARKCEKYEDLTQLDDKALFNG